MSQFKFLFELAFYVFDLEEFFSNINYSIKRFVWAALHMHTWIIKLMENSSSQLNCFDDFADE